MNGTDDELEVTINGATILFKRCNKDGLYYTKLRRIINNNEEYCHDITTNATDQWEVVGRDNKLARKTWPKMNKVEAHNKWGHPHEAQLHKMANHYQVQLTGKLESCSGCGLVKSRAKATTRTCNQAADENGERIFIDTVILNEG